MWSIEKLPTLDSTNIHLIHISLSILQTTSVTSYTNFLKSWRYFKKQNLQMTTKSIYTYSTFKQPLQLGRVVVSKLTPIRLFNIYSTLLTQNSTIKTRVHPSQKFFFLIETKLNTRPFNLTKILTKWLDIYHLLLNLLYYRVPMLMFGTPTFKRELISVNWLLHSKIKHYWKYVSNSFYTSRNKVIKHEFILFNYLNKEGYSIGFIFDALYHQNTIFLLKRNNFFTLGLVPISMNLYTVNFALPITNDSVFIHLFFIRFFIYTKKIATTIHIGEVKNMWKTFSNL